MKIFSSTDRLQAVTIRDAGRHTEPRSRPTNSTALIRFAQTLFRIDILYSIAIAVCKTSILLLYKRVFGAGLVRLVLGHHRRGTVHPIFVLSTVLHDLVLLALPAPMGWGTGEKFQGCRRLR